MTYSRAAYFLRLANEDCRPPKQREIMFNAYEKESWFDAVMLRDFPVIALPDKFRASVLMLIHQRHIGPLSGFQVRR